MLILAAIISWMNLKGKFMSRNLRLAKKFYDQGHVFTMKGDLDAAISNYKMAVNMDSDFVPAHNALGHAFSQKEN
ncbi:MAG: tetratricopeptide repeat protein [Methanosarcinales archaeon]